jgi:hypothetical protein
MARAILSRQFPNHVVGAAEPAASAKVAATAGPVDFQLPAESAVGQDGISTESKKLKGQKVMWELPLRLLWHNRRSRNDWRNLPALRCHLLYFL